MTQNPFSMPLFEVKDMKHLPFLVFKRGERRFYSICFKNEQTGKYLTAISTKKDTKAEAIQTAFEWLKNSIPKKGEAIQIKKYLLRDMLKESDTSKADTEFICKELQRRGLLKSFVIEKSVQSC